MFEGAPRPVLLSICKGLLFAASYLAPRVGRENWRREWQARIWHRWQFLHHAGGWNRTEQLRLFLTALSAIPDALWQYLSQEGVRRRTSDFIRSPWTCLGLLASALLLIVSFTGGAPATRQVIREWLDPGSGRLVIMWLQPFGGTPRGIPPDVVPDWRKESRNLESVASFTLRELHSGIPGVGHLVLPVVSSDPHLFEVLKVRPFLGAVTTPDFTAIDYRIWKTEYHRDPDILGKEISISGTPHVISAVLPPGFSFLTRKPCVYVARQYGRSDTVMVVGRVRATADPAKLEKELAHIARKSDYYFFLVDPKLRSTTLAGVVFSPVRLFALALSISLFPMLWFSRVRPRHIRAAWLPENRSATRRRILFFLTKVTLALSIVFVAALEWERPESSLMLSWADGGGGLAIVWLYSLGAMAALFGAVADQRGRCRVCLRLLAFPVRIGRPGSLLLDWGGTEFLCPEGHGVLHIPQLATSWDEDADRWIKLDDSWR